MEHIEWISHGHKVRLDYGLNPMSVREVLRRIRTGHYLPRALFEPSAAIIRRGNHRQIHSSDTLLTIFEAPSDETITLILDDPINFYTLCTTILDSEFPLLRAPLLDFEMTNTRELLENYAKKGIRELLTPENQELCYAVYCTFTTFDPELQA